MDAPRGSVELDESDELQRLRRRAYGPDADIAGDTEAQARLSELEAARRGQLTTDAVAAAPDPIVALHAAPRWRRRRFVILSAAIAALALNAAAIVWMSLLLTNGFALVGSTSTVKPPFPVGQRGGYYVPDPDYSLALKSIGYYADVPNDRHGILTDLSISPDELRRYDDFQGLNVWSGESSSGLVCLFVALPVQGLREGLSAEGCSLRGLDTIADLQEGGDRHIRFVLRDDRVNVYVYERPTDPNASHGERG